MSKKKVSTEVVDTNPALEASAALQNYRYFKIFLVVAVVLVLGISFKYLTAIVAPFVVALIVSYILDPLVTKLEKFIPRAAGSAIACTVFFGFLLIVFLLLFPLIYEQFYVLILQIPGYAEKSFQVILPKVQEIAHSFHINLDKFGLTEDGREKIIPVITSKISHINEIIVSVLSTALTSIKALISFLFLIILTPVISLYILQDWGKVLSTSKSFIPVPFRDFITNIVKDVHLCLIACIRGQLSVSIILAVYYVTFFSALGLNHSFIVGLLTGFASIVPYIGTGVALIVVLLVGMFQYGVGYEMGILLFILMLGQVLDNTMITPNIIGKSLKLHPVWIIFGLLSAAALFGFWGIVLSMPLTAVFSVLIRHLVAIYKSSNFYLGS